MNSNKIRSVFLDYFKNHGHKIVESSSLIPINDPTLLFTNAGMVPFKDVLLGVEKRPYVRAVSSQKCLRVGGKHNDLDNVGYTARHHTFFEMLGNFSFGDYFKKETIEFAWDLLTNKYSLPKDRLWVTVFKDDDESESIWKEDIGMPSDRISRLDKEDNFWTMGDTGPCGPCSEIFYDHGSEFKGSPPAKGSDPGDRFIEFWNLVFTQFDRSQDGTLSLLPNPCVDTGMGLERMAAILQGKHNNFETDLFTPLIEEAATLCEADDLNDPSLNVISDHLRASAFLVADGVSPSNEGRGYVLRRIIRRALRHADKLGSKKPVLSSMVPTLIKQMGDAYPILKKNSKLIKVNILEEEEQFALTLVQGMSLLKEEVKNLKEKNIPGELVFKLYDTYGFPPDMTADFARENNLKVDLKGYEEAMIKQKERGRGASNFTSILPESVNIKGTTSFFGYEREVVQSKVTGVISKLGVSVDVLRKGEEGLVILDKTPFYAESGGQVGDIGIITSKGVEFQVEDTQEIGDHIGHLGKINKGTIKKGMSVEAKIDIDRRKKITSNHSATHLLNAALRNLFGSNIEQRGSHVNENRLRFDFTHSKLLSPEEIRNLEEIINTEIRKNSLAITEVMSKKQAEKKGAIAFFGEKYGDKVRVLALGDNFSVELCGGTHVKRTGDIGLFKLTDESSISAGVRRVEAVTGEIALNLTQSLEQNLKEAASFLNTSMDQVSERVKHLLELNKSLKTELQQSNESGLDSIASDISSEVINVGTFKLLTKRLDGEDNSSLRSTADNIRKNRKNFIVVLISVVEDKIPVVVALSKDIKLLDARDIMEHIVNQLGGSGGGRPDLAQGGVENEEDIDFVLSSLEDFLLSSSG